MQLSLYESRAHFPARLHRGQPLSSTAFQPRNTGRSSPRSSPIEQVLYARPAPSLTEAILLLQQGAKSAGNLALTVVFCNCTVKSDELNSSIRMPKSSRQNPLVVSALRARTSFGALLRRIETEPRSLVIEKRGTPRAVLLSIRDYLRLAAPEPEILRVLGQESKRKGTNRLTSRQIDRIIAKARTRKRKR